jgi:DNA-directed RNA polymerase specialized sigma24 family protein
MARWEGDQACRRTQKQRAAALKAKPADKFPERDPFLIMEQRETEVKLRAGIGALPMFMRQPLVLYFDEGLTQKEIAQRCKRDQPAIHLCIRQGLD